MPETLSPPPMETVSFRDPDAAVARIREIYERNTNFLRENFKSYLSGHVHSGKYRATYPFVRMTTRSHALVDSRFAYGFVSQPGIHETTVTRPDVFGAYLREQIALLLENHDVEVGIGESDEPIPIHFAYRRDINLETGPPPQEFAQVARPLRDVFDVPDLTGMDDTIINGTLEVPEGKPQPLALFRAGRIDYSLHRLLHYTGTSPTHFQNFVIFTNYQFYLDAFVGIGRDRVRGGKRDSLAFVEPGDFITRRAADGSVETSGTPAERMPQMPAYHLVGENNSGITIINIGAGPSNARTMTDHVAVLRPHAWLMLGHCAGLRNTQKLGDYVLAHGYVREDHVLDEDLPTWVPIPALAEVQVALESAVAEVTGFSDYDLKKVMRTGTVASVDNRNWELSEHSSVMRRLSQSRAIALDMESAAIAANGFRCRVPYGTLLCVSDKPLHGEIKLAGMAGEFYRQRVDQHLEIGLKALERLQNQERGRLHSRKLRSITEVAFQ